MDNCAVMAQCVYRIKNSNPLNSLWSWGQI